VQAKLTVGQSGDRYEREADAVADRVTSGKPSGEVSRIPAGGLGAQRQAEDGAAGDEAQAKCASCASEDAAQRAPEDGAPAPAAQEGEPARRSEDGEHAQAKCSECAEEAAQRQPASPAGGQGQGPDEGRESEDREARDERDGGTPECEPPADRPEPEGPERERAPGPDLSCGTDAEEEAPPAAAPPAGPGGAGCARATQLGTQAVDTAASAVGLPGTQGGGVADTSVPGCADPVRTGQDSTDDTKPPTEASPSAPGGASTTEACAPAQRKEEPGDEEGAAGAQRAEDESQPKEEQEIPTQRAEDDSQSKSQEEGAAQRREDDAQSKSQDEGDAQRQEDEAQSKGDEKAGAQRAEDEGQSKSQEEGAAQGQEDEAQSKGDDDAAQRQEDEAQTKGNEEAGAQRAEDESQSKEEHEGAAQRQEDEAQSKETDECMQREEEEAQSRAAGPPRRRLQTGVASRHIQARGSGDALLPSVRDRLEANMGVDLEGVRVHADSNAQAASRALHAKAFTHRNHIFLGPGQSPQDVALLAHESTHVLQQDAVVRRKPARAPDRAEQEAGAAAEPTGPAAEAPAPATGAAARTGAAPAGAAGPGAPPVPLAARSSVRAPIPMVHSPREVAPGAKAGGAASERSAHPEVGGAAGGAKSRETPTATATPTATTTATAVVTAVATGAASASPTTPRAAAPANAPAAHGAPKAPGAQGKAPSQAAGAAAGPAASAEIARNGGESPVTEPAEAPAGGDGLQRVLSRLETVALGQKAHAPAQEKARAAQAAAKPPANEGASRADQTRAAVMAQAQPGKTQPEDLYLTLCHALNDITPKKLKDVDEFKEQGRAGELKEQLQGHVDSQKNAAESAIGGVARAKDPDPEEVEPAVDLPPEATEREGPAVGAREALPAPKPDEEVSGEDTKKRADQLMAENDLDEEQLREANDPDCDEALASKKQVEVNADQLPGKYRKEEAAVLAGAGAQVESSEKDARLGMHEARTGSRRAVRSRQVQTRSRDEADRQKVADDVELMFRTTRDSVMLRLDFLDTAVSTTFDTEEASARAQFEAYVTAKMTAYKNDRYGGLLGGGYWLKDKFFDLPDEVNDFYVEGRKIYIRVMKAALHRIVDLVNRELKAAKKLIDDGKERIDKHVKGLKGRLKTAGAQAAASVGMRFEQLEGTVEDRKQALADDLVRKVKDARAKLEKRIEELKAENEGLLTKLGRKLKEIAKMLREFKTRISGLLHASGDVLWQIVKHPIRFLENMLGAVKGGFHQFKEHIGRHLKHGVVRWMFGSLGDAGVELPSGFGPRAIFSVVLQVLGLTPQRLRAKLAEIVGPRNVERLEAAKAWLETVLAKGPGAIWELLKEKFADLKDLVLDAVKGWVEREIVKQAIAFVVSLFNPVSALLKAIKLIYDVVMFIVENIDLILKVLEAVVASLAAIVAGKIQSAADWIETTLGNIVAAVIAFLARVFGLSGIADRIRSVIKSIRDRVESAIDWVLGKVAKGMAWVGGKLRRGAGKAVAAARRFLFPSRSFQAGKETHRLYFEGQDPQAQLLVSSDTKRLRKFVKELAARRNRRPGADAKLAAVAAQLDRIDVARKLLKADPAKAASDIDAALALIAKNLAPLLADDDAGTIANPYGVAWPKRPLARYDRLYVGPKVGKRGIRILQDDLAEARTRADEKAKIKARLVNRKGKPTPALEAWKARGFAVDVYDPEGKRALPEGGETIGVDPIWQVRDGMKFELHPGSKSGGGGKVNRALKPYGYSPGDEGRDGDHVLERQVGGADALENLWPLDLGENRASGATLASAQLRVPGESTTIPMETAKKRARNQSVWLVIDRTGKAKRRL